MIPEYGNFIEKGVNFVLPGGIGTPLMLLHYFLDL
jgi:hypothetical protein